MKKILYLTQKMQKPIIGHGIYADLICSLKDKGHFINIVAADANKTYEETISGIKILHVGVGNQFNVNYIKKGIVFLLIKHKVINAIKKHLKKEQYDLLLYEAPPVTFAKVIKYCKKIFGCKTYLMQKDIFPQNAVDIGILNKAGLKGVIYKYFKHKEKELYSISDKIGCMSQGNINYLASHNPEIVDKLEIFPNSISLTKESKIFNNKSNLKNQLVLEKDKIYFIYGGNLGKPQGLDFLLSCIEKLNNYDKACFIIIGRGTEKEKVKKKAEFLNNLIFYEEMPSEKYIEFVSACDVGIVSLDKRFTIPNYPSRILDYMKYSLPIIACTDEVTDFKDLITRQARCGLWSVSGDVDAFCSNVRALCENDKNLLIMGENGNSHLKEFFNTDVCVDIIEKFLEK